MRSSLLTSAIVLALGTASFNVAAAPHKHHHKAASSMAYQATTAPANVQADRMAERDNEIAELKTMVADLQARVDELSVRTDAQSTINVNTQTAVDALQTASDKTVKTVNDTGLSGKIFADVTGISQTSHGVKTNATGTGIDVKRFYLSATHQFDDTWSANLTTDFNYVSNDGETNLFVKKAYLQGKYSDAAIFRIGSADMPWIPYVENYYGFRYVENTLTDKLKYANSADWGLHLGGKFADQGVDYAVSVVNGGGYKNPSRSKGMDIEGRIGFAPNASTIVSVGAYSGTLGKETESVNSQHTANRIDVLAAYANQATRLGVEYFQANNWNNVLAPLGDKADGYSLWGSIGLSDMATAFARYDRASLSKDIDPSLKDTYFNIGVEWLLRKGVKVSAVYKNDRQKDDSRSTDLKTEELGVFGEVAF